MRLSRICAESGLMPTLSPRHMLPLLKFRHLLSGRCRVKRPFSTTLSFRSRPAFCISLIPKLPAYLFTPSKGVVLSRNSSAPSEGVQFSRVFCSPSEGAQSPGALCRVCARVSVSSRLLPPSEGAQSHGPSVAPVFAFLFPAASFHLPKAGQIRQYPYHLWKVSTSIFSATAADSAFLCRCGKGPGRQCCLENL